MKAMPNFGSSWLRRALCALAAFSALSAAFAQDYPSRPVRVVVPSAPGGGFDLVGRLLAGHVDLFYDNTTTTRPYVESGQVKALAVSSRVRAPTMPKLPTLVETGVVDLEMETWFGLFAPARTPRAIVERLRAEVDRATRSAEVRSRLEMGSGRSLRIAPAETEAFVRAEVAKWTRLLRRARSEERRVGKECRSRS